MTSLLMGKKEANVTMKAITHLNLRERETASDLDDGRIRSYKNMEEDAAEYICKRGERFEWTIFLRNTQIVDDL